MKTGLDAYGRDYEVLRQRKRTSYYKNREVEIERSRVQGKKRRAKLRQLQIDHINGGGNQERKRLQYITMCNRVLTHRDEYQLLCANCNWIKRAEQHESYWDRIPDTA